ncbi:head-tail connector protein [Brucella sp. C7-11G]
MQLAPVRVGVTGELPVTRDEAKRHVGAVGFTSDDLDIDGFIKSATGYLEKLLGMALVKQSWRQDLSCFPSRFYLTPFPVISLTSVKYRSDGVLKTLDVQDYELYSDITGPFVQFFSQNRPQTSDRPDAVQVTYESGFEPDELPAALKAAILIHVGYLYGHRGQPDMPTIEDIPAYQMLVWPHRRLGV